MRRQSPGAHSRAPGAGRGLVASAPRVQFRVTQEQLGVLMHEAAAAGVSVAEAARVRIFARPLPSRKITTAPRERATTIPVPVRLTAEQGTQLSRAAGRCGLSVSELARALCFPAPEPPASAAAVQAHA